MSKSDEYLKAFLKIVDEASKAAKEKDDLGLKLLDVVGEKFDEYVVSQHFRTQHQNISIKRTVKAILSLPRTLDFGPEPIPKVKEFIDALEKSKCLKRSQLRLINVYHMLRFEEDGSCKILEPSSFDFIKAKTLFVITSILTSIIVIYIWQNAEILNQNLLVIYTVGTLLGYFFRGAYDLAWGRENLANYMKTRYPWFVLEQEAYIKI